MAQQFEPIKELMPVNRPLEWLTGDVWTWLSEYSDKKEYDRLDYMYRCINGTVSIREYNRLNHTRYRTSQLYTEYSQRFPIMLAHTLRSIIDDMLSGDIKFKIDFDDIEP